ncbi:MAG: nitrite/sulfite reductase, partial [Pseudomonadota bacterium]
FKIAVTGSPNDLAVTKAHDIGLRMVRDAAGEPGYEVIVGGGLGRTPVIGALIRSAMPIEHLLTYLESCMRVYNRYGRRDNKYKARIKILVRALTAEGFREKADEEWAFVKDGPSTVPADELQRLVDAFAPPAFAELDDAELLLQEQRLAHPQFSRWLHNNVTPHKQSGYAGVTLSTKVTGVPPGDVSDEQMEAVADWADALSFGELRISHEQNFVLPHVPQENLLELWQAATAAGLGDSNVGLLTDMICCPGGDYCSLANAKSIPVAEAIQRRFDNYDYLHDLGDLDINISGCMNACGHHHVGHIGILGVDKKGQEFYQISLGGHSGHSGQAASLGQIVGPSFAREEVTDVIDTVLNVYLEQRLSGDAEQQESFLSCFQRIGMEPFKERVYATSD